MQYVKSFIISGFILTVFFVASRVHAEGNCEGLNQAAVGQCNLSENSKDLMKQFCDFIPKSPDDVQNFVKVQNALFYRHRYNTKTMLSLLMNKYVCYMSAIKYE